MKSRAGFTSLLVFLTFALFQLAACSGTPSTFNKVTITPSGTQFIGQNGSIALSATVLNDAAGNGGVTFSASPAGTGTLTQLTTTTGTYVAPAAVTTETVVMITATSVDFPNQSATLTVKIEPPPVITTTSLPTATLNASYTAPVMATGGVPPLSWTIASGTLPAGLSLGSSKTHTVNITGKATTAGQSIVTIMVTDAVGETSTSGPLTIVVSTLAFTTTSPLPSGTVNVPYAGVQFAASGGNSPYTFTLAAGAVLPPGLVFSAGGDLTGTPTTEGTYTFGVTVTDSTTPTPAVITQNFTLSVTPPQNLSLLSGNYAFTFSGNNSGGYVAAAGVFTANGNGTITAGEADYNALNGSPVNVPNLQGTYTVGQDGRGTITFTNVTGSPIYAFSIDASGTGNIPGSHGRMVEFDSTGTRGSGRLEMQSVTTCVVNSTNSTYNGNYAFGGTGFQSSAGGNAAGTMAFAGVLTAVPPSSGGTVGSIGPAEIDANYNGSAAVGSVSGTALSGAYQSGPDPTHCQFQLSAFSNLDYDVYPISATDAFLIETDQASNATSPFISVAEMKLQFGQPFFGSVISGPMAGGVSGQVLSVPYVSVLQLVPQVGITTFNLSLTDNEAGTITSTNGTPFSVTYTTDQYGRVFANGFEVNNAFEPVLYMIDSQDAFAVGQLNGAPMFGEFDAQSKPTSFTPTFIEQGFPLIEGTVAPPVSAARDFSGFLNFNGSVTPATVNGIQDESTASANTAAEAVTGTYVLSSTGATDGSGTITLTSPAAFTGAFYFVSPTKMVEITTTTGDGNPVLIIIGD
ncbi:MAG: putative Ig domain-containing protein [Candidatus Acidiferrales bacterium]